MFFFEYLPYALASSNCWPALRIDGHRLRRRPGTAAATLPWYSLPITCSWPAPPLRWPPVTPATRNGCSDPALVFPADHLQLAGTTASMATGCAGDQERLQGPCPGTPRPITGSWPTPPA